MRVWLWLLWLVIAVWFAVPPLLWHAEIYAGHSPGMAARLLPAVAPLMAVGLAVYSAVRRKGLWKLEGVLLGAVPIAMCLAWEPWATIVAGWLAISAYAAGLAVLEAAGIKLQNPLEELPLAGAVGFGVLSCLLFVMGLAGLYYRWAFVLLLAAPLAVAPRALRRLASAIRRLFESWTGMEEWASPLLATAVCFGVVSAVLTAVTVITPTIAFDPLKMHFVSVSHFVEKHGLVYPPTFIEAFMPQGVEVLMAAAWSLGGQMAAQMVEPVFFCLTMLLVVRILRDCGYGKPAAVVGAISGATIPFLHWTGSVPKNDLAMTLYLLGCLYCYLRWRRENNFRLLVAGAFLLAMAFGVKHVALLGAAGLVPLYMHAVWKQPRRVRAAAILASVFLLFGTHWMVRTYRLTGSALYPYSFERATQTSAVRAGTNRLAKAQRILRLPWRAHFAGQRNFDSVTPNPLGVLFLFLCPAWVMHRRKTTEAERACLIYCGVHCVYWVLMINELRYIIAPILILAGLTACRTVDFCASRGQMARLSLRVAFFFVMLFAVTVTGLIELSAAAPAYLAGRIDRAGYLRRSLVTFPVLEELGRRAGKGDRVFSLNNCSSAYAPEPWLFYCAYKGDLEDWPERMAKEIQKTGCRFVILTFDPVGRKTLEVLRKHVRVEDIWQDSRFSLHRIGGGGPARATSDAK